MKYIGLSLMGRAISVRLQSASECTEIETNRKANYVLKIGKLNILNISLNKFSGIR
jgi:hypothetical protein